MIEAADFIEPARQRGFDFWAGVPCSFLTPFINAVIEDPGLDYVAAANEGDAVATASGAALAGRRGVAIMQNSGLGNAVSPLSSLNWVFRIPILLIITLRGEPGLSDEPQHELMGQVTGSLLDTLEIAWDWFPQSAGDIEVALEKACRHMAGSGLPYALIMRKGSVAPYPLQDEWRAAPRPPDPAARVDTGAGPQLTRRDALAAVIEATPENDAVVIGSTGYTGRELFALADRPNHFYMVGSMGCASSLGLGLSMACPDRKVVVADGDGAALMRMGNLPVIGAYGGSNYFHLLLDNGVHESTGGQASVSGAVRFAGVAQHCGYRNAAAGNDRAALDAFLGLKDGPSFLHLAIRRGVPQGLPRPDVTPRQVRARLMVHLGVAPGHLRG